MNLTSTYLKKLISDKAKELGFVQTGFSKVEVLEKEASYLSEWLNKGYAADMHWIEKGFEKRRDIRLIMPDAKSVISLAYNYYTPIEHSDAAPKISRYAWGKDYHKILKKKLNELCEFINEIIETTPLSRPFIQRGEERSSGGFKKDSTQHLVTQNEGDSRLRGNELMMKPYIDDGPVMDKVWAVKSGIGAIGKHTNVINTSYGSWIFICNIITNIEFDSYDYPIEDLCGSCTLCISACPTGAIIDEYVVDANKCISYQTIENRGDIPENINLEGWIFGCDVCQDVCPYNSPKYNHPSDDLNFYPKKELMKTQAGFSGKDELNSITEIEFNLIFADSPIKRTKYKGWKRNLDKVK